MTKSLIFVLNCGSSSIKFAVIDPTTTHLSLSGIVQRIDTNEATLSYSLNGTNKTETCPNINYQIALQTIINIIKNNPEILAKLLAVGHRVVHGGEKFTRSVVINEKILQAIRECGSLAPLHNPANILGIEKATRSFPELKQIAVFDTAFHQTMPEYAYIYPIPYELYQQHQIRRYGFHGSSHRFVTQKAVALLKKEPSAYALISAHLGNVCSVAAILNGKSVDTSMGLTPLEGLVMGSRSGDVDPSLHLHLANSLGYDLKQITAMLNQQSGLLGISGADSDMRTIEQKATSGNKRATLALEVFCYRLAKYIAALIVPLGKVDALIFTGGIGENSWIVRSKVLTWLKFVGFNLDPMRNKIHGKSSLGIITKESEPIAIVIPTNEELLIAEDSRSLAKTL